MNVVVQGREGATALVVDEVGDVVEVASRMEPSPGTVPERVRELVAGVHELDGRLLLVLVAERAAAVEHGREC